LLGYQISYGVIEKIEAAIFKNKTNKQTKPGCQWLTPVVLATQEAEIRRIKV
jgi:hypothetical protein